MIRKQNLISVRVFNETYKMFKDSCAQNGVSMNEILKECIHNFILYTPPIRTKKGQKLMTEKEKLENIESWRKEFQKKINL